MVNLSAIMDEFIEDAANGQGEAMTAMAVSMGVQPEDRAAFAQAVHTNFDSIFPTADVTAEQVYSSIVDVMKADTRLAKYVS